VKPDALKQAIKPEEFWFALIRDNHVDGDADIDLEQIIREHRAPHRPVEF
jgi:hypothetical protein